MSPIPIQAWDASEHESGASRVIHLDLAKDLSKHSSSVSMLIAGKTGIHLCSFLLIWPSLVLVCSD